MIKKLNNGKNELGFYEIGDKVNELIDIINKLKGTKNE